MSTTMRPNGRPTSTLAPPRTPVQSPPPPRAGGRRNVVLVLTLLVALAAFGLSLRASLDDRPTTSALVGQPAAAGPYRIDGAGTGRVVNVALKAVETTQEVAPGVRYHTWTFDGTAPGPVIRVHVGDTVHFSLTNSSTMGMDHSIDFHAAQMPWNTNYQAVAPGKTLTFDWVARFPGVFMYHCGTPPVLAHIANGMYGAIIVEPWTRPPADREYVLVQSELYPGKTPVHGVYQGDLARMRAADPQYVVFNGKADQYKSTPLLARPNELVRLWVLNAGPTLPSAFHVIGALFDHVYPDGNPTNQLNGLQTYNVAPGAGGMFELRIPEAGLYPFVTHAFAYTDRGAIGVLKVAPDAPAPTRLYPQIGDPFSAGTRPVGQNAAPSAPSTSAASPGSAPSAPPAGAGTAACKPSGTALQIMAMLSKFDTGCLAVPAGKPFTITMANHDAGVPHNLAIYTDETASKPLFQGKLITGPASITDHVSPLPAGRYFFRCDVHPQMKGAVRVG
jgi:nitrite reductase (NO-forming)